MITHPEATADTLHLLQVWRAALPHIPVSILSNPSTLTRDDLQAFKAHGADIFTIALDAATPRLFEELRGKPVGGPHRHEKYLEILEMAAEIFGPGRFGVHLIAGLGETVQEMLTLIHQIHNMGGHSHLFAFFPEAGSLLQHRPACNKAHWRNIQLGRYLLEHGGARWHNMAFSPDGNITDFGIAAQQLKDIIHSGLPFRTSGCPGSDDPRISACNRPFGDSRPSAIMSFPFAPAADDIAGVISEMMHHP